MFLQREQASRILGTFREYKFSGKSAKRTWTSSTPLRRRPAALVHLLGHAPRHRCYAAAPLAAWPGGYSSVSRSDTVILRTGHLYEADMLAEALTEQAIPFYRRVEGVTGLETAMPAMPEQGPGVYFTVLVPPAAVIDARAVLAELPISAEEYPSIWGYNPRPWAKTFWQWMAWITVGLFVVSLLAEVIDNLLKL